MRGVHVSAQRQKAGCASGNATPPRSRGAMPLLGASCAVGLQDG